MCEENCVRDEDVVAIVGGGLVGSLAANFMAKRGYNVEIYEKREDIRKMKLAKGRSINLSLSNRGRRALRALGLEEEVLKAGVPMKGRLIHSVDGKTKSLLYDSVNNECLYSISRNYLNVLLLKALDNNPKVKLFFNHKLTSANFNQTQITLLNTLSNTQRKSSPKFVLAADGAYSAVRTEIQKSQMFTFSQTYIEHGYMELSIDATFGKAMIPNHLHIWPRGTFMMIALPNLDDSWTVTLFMPFAQFDKIKNSEDLIHFFEQTFPDYFNFVLRKNLIQDFFSKKPMPLVSIKCAPYNHNNFLLIGDAAHAMVPFYGQGMNAGFEDCLILDKLFNDNVCAAFRSFSEVRCRDAHAICDLAMYNYKEMRCLVTKLRFRTRKRFDEIMFWWFPRRWIPLYNSVTFTTMGYQECVENREWQNKFLTWAFTVCTAVPILSAILCHIDII